MSATNDKGTGMTREEAKSILRNAAWLGTNEDRERIERAVELLCGESCEDTISRKASIAALKKHFSDDGMIDTERGAYWHHGHVIDVLQGMPSVTPKQRTGHWQEVYAETDYRNGWIEFSCENCEYQHGLESGEYGWSYGDPIPWKYCPICGARMVDPQERNEE